MTADDTAAEVTKARNAARMFSSYVARPFSGSVRNRRVSYFTSCVSLFVDGTSFESCASDFVNRRKLSQERFPATLVSPSEAQLEENHGFGSRRNRQPDRQRQGRGNGGLRRR